MYYGYNWQNFFVAIDNNACNHNKILPRNDHTMYAVRQEGQYDGLHLWKDESVTGTMGITMAVK